MKKPEIIGSQNKLGSKNLERKMSLESSVNQMTKLDNNGLDNKARVHSLSNRVRGSYIVGVIGSQ